MLARNEDEMKLYEQMDQERYEEEKKIYPNFKHPEKTEEKFENYRLITYEEIPDWLKQEDKPQEDKREYGRGNRVRKQVSYVLDIPNDEQWDKSDDEDGFISEVSDQKVRKTRSQKNQPEEEKKFSQKRSLRKRPQRIKKNELPSEESETEKDQEGTEGIMESQTEEEKDQIPERRLTRKKLKKGVTTRSKDKDKNKKRK